MHSGKCSFCWARRRCLTREARSTWVEVLQNPNLFRPTKEDRLAQLQCPGVQLLRRLRTRGRSWKPGMKNGGERVKFYRCSLQGHGPAQGTDWLCW